MAKQRYINTKFWSDTYISNLDPVEKLLFLYLFTNERTSICGMYELPLKLMAVETGIEKEMIEKILKRFTKDKKVFYYQGWVRMVNFPKHQDTGNEKIRKGIELAESLIPAQIKDKLYAMDSLSIPLPYVSNNSNTNSNTNSNNIPTKVGEDFILDIELEKLKKSGRKDIRLVGYYFRRAKLDLPTREVFSKELKRCLATAKTLKDFSQEKIMKAFDYAESNYPLWTMETLSKVITKL